MHAEDFLNAPAAAPSADDFLGPDPAAPGVTLKDLGVSLKQGVERVPGQLAGLADIPLGLAGLDRPVSKAADLVGEVTGFQPGKWAKEADAQHSPGYHAQQQALNQSWDSSGANTLSTALLDPNQWDKLGELWDQVDGKALAKTVAQNPGAVGAMTLESLPGMAVGGAIGRGLKAGAAAAGLEGLAADTAGAAALRAGAGEGAVTAGQTMDQIDPSVDPQTAAAASLAAGGITGLIGGGSGRLAAKLGLPDIEMAMASGKMGGSPLSLLKRLPASMVQEGLLEELPQSMQEQVWQNAAEGKPLGEGMLRQGVEGMLAGMATAGGFSALPQGRSKEAPPAAPPTNQDLDKANQELRAATDAYAPESVPLLPNAPFNMPAPPEGTLAAAAYTAQQMGVTQDDPTAQLLKAYPTMEAAQAALEQRPDAELLNIVSHPRGDSGFAIVRKSPGEVAQIQQAAQEQGMRDAANQEAQVRQAQLAQEEEASRRESQTFKSVVDLNRNAAALEKSITEDTPPAQASTIRAQAAEMRTRAEELLQQAKTERQTRTAEAAKASAQPPAAAAADGTLAQAQIGDATQDELAPAAMQPVETMPAMQAAQAQKAQAAAAQVQAANTAGQVRQDQLAQEEEAPSVDEAAARANTAPTEGQKEAGNYAKGHVTVGGLQIAVENPAGSSRSGTEGGKKWTTRMRAHYGYVKRTTGADGDPVDVYVKPGTKTDHEGPVFVVDQYDPSTGAFDEHKVLLGYGSQAEASKAYDSHFGDKSGPTRRGAVTQMTMPAFKQWLRNGDTTAPTSSTKFGGQTASEGEAAQEEIRQSGGRLSTKRGEVQETPEQRLERKAAESNTKKQQQRAAQAGLRSRADHEAAINTALGIDDAEVITEMSGANQAAEGEVSKQHADFIRQVARLFKKKVVFFRSATSRAADGAWRTDGDVIYLNSTSSVAQLRVLGHELLHAMRVQAPEAFEKMRSALANLLTDEQLAAQHQDYFGTELTEDLDKPASGTGDQTLRDFLTEEWMADLSGNRFGEAKFWEEVFSEIESSQGTEKAKGIVARLRMAISNAINQLLQLIKGGKFSVDSRLAGQLDQVRAAVKDGFVAYEKASKAGQLQSVMSDRALQSAKRPESDVGHKRTSKGDYVGAPAGMTPAKLGALRKRLFSLAMEGEPGRFWYEDSSRLILAAAEGDAARAEKIAGLLAIYSPNATVSANTTMGLKALYQWMNGDPIKVRFEVQDAKAEAWMAGTMAEEDAMQIKTGNFFRNLMRKIDEERYGFEQQGATIDMWMARVFGYNSKAVGSSARYYFAEREVTRLANELGWEPQQVQAALWVAIKSRIEAIADEARAIGQKKGWLKKVEKTSKGKTNISWMPINKEAEEQYEGLMLKMALATGADPSGLTKAAYRFGTALRERVGQISWEAIPGKTTGVLPGIFEAPLAQQAEYLAAIDSALRDEEGQDLIAKKLGLPTISTAFGPSAWQMNVGAGAQTEVVIPVVKKEGVTASARALLNSYAAIRGYVLAQEAVVWHYPVFDASKKNANGVQLDFGRDPTHDEVAQLYQALYAVSGRDDWAPAYVPGVGVRVLNFAEPSFDEGEKAWVYWGKDGQKHSDKDRAVLMKLAEEDGVTNPQFHALVREAANRLDADVELATFQSEGDYIGNDWGAHPDGAQYKEAINASSSRVSRGAGRSDLQGWVESELRPRVERVNQEFSEKYGWGKVRFSTPRESDRSRAEHEGSPGRLRAPGYGTRQPGGLSLQGFHYSPDPRTHLGGNFYGSGMPGAESRRLDRISATPEQRYRIHYYVDEGAGVSPEVGVGSHLHTTQLNNLYDWVKDEKGFWEAARQQYSDKADRTNWVEQQIMLAGFDGVYAPKAQGDQGVIVLLGSKHTNVPVSYLGRSGRIENGQPLDVVNAPAPSYRISAPPPVSAPAAEEGPDRLGPFSSESIANLSKGFWQKKGVSYSTAQEDGKFWLHRVGAASSKLSTARDSTLSIFEGLASRGLKLRRAEEALATRQDAATIRYIHENILDILDTLETSGAVMINC